MTPEQALRALTETIGPAIMADEQFSHVETLSEVVGQSITYGILGPDGVRLTLTVGIAQ